jgi:hypothetical protein
MCPPRPPNKLDALNWIWDTGDQCGLYIHPHLAFIHNRESGYAIATVVATRLKQGTVVARIPKTCIMSPRTTHVPLRAILETVDWPAIVKLALVFLYEFWLNKASRFAGYNMIFYGEDGGLVVPDVPRLWTKEEKVYLGGTEIADRKGDSDVPCISSRKIDDIRPMLCLSSRVMSHHLWITIPKSFFLKPIDSSRKTGLKVLSSWAADVFMYSRPQAG